MKTIKNTLFIAVLFSIALQLYLSLHYYQLHSAQESSGSICNINKVFNCDAVSASSFSNIAGIPISNIGLALHLVILALLILNKISPLNSQKRLQSALNLATFSLLGSIIMAGISVLFLNVYCLFCIGLYLLSIIIWFTLRKLLPRSTWNIKSLFNKNLLLKPVIAIAVLSFFSHVLLSAPKNKDFKRQMRFIVDEWESNPAIHLNVAPMLHLGASKANAKIIITEFADYQCPHCKHADPKIKAFVLANSNNTRLEFYPFPLDSQCNPALKFSRGGLTCTLTKAVFCANKQDKGWAVHHFVFDNQSQIKDNYNASQFSLDIKKAVPGLKINQWKSCLDSQKTQDSILAFAQAGQTAQVQGTPSFLVNTRKLENAQFLPVLDAVKSKILKKSRH
ncbi:MAG: thioredoxin domain-containing protein [Bdellovibrionaceae bacterium]|nr:thioredoxin domain-containing protein [Pseudobdellovibrionaceae bacterium]